MVARFSIAETIKEFAFSPSLCKLRLRFFQCSLVHVASDARSDGLQQSGLRFM